MISSGRNVDLRERSVFISSKARLALKKMPMLSNLSRRFNLLTTDAKPDPPRTGIASYTHNLPPTQDEETKKARSAPITPEEARVNNSVPPPRRQKLVPNDVTPTKNFCEKPEDLGHAEPKEYKRPRVKTKVRHGKCSQGTNVVNYNIVNSNGVKIGSRTSYICNVNQFVTNQTTAEATSSKSKNLRPIPKDVEDLSSCDEELAFEDMMTIKTHVGHGWRDVARRLSYSDGQIEQFEENYRHKGVDEVIYQLLLDWKQANTQDAQLGRLVSILWSCQEYDCVERLVAARKTSS